MFSSRFLRKVLMIMLLPVLLYSQKQIGTIKGKIIDMDTKSSLYGATISLAGTVTGAISDMDGNYEIKNVPIGNHVLNITYVGYESIKISDVIVRPARITFADAELKVNAANLNEVTVTSGYFKKREQPMSVVAFGYEEVRRAPGALGDVSRIIMNLPSVAKVDDQTNLIVVRGGSPIENAIYIDNFEVPNINHYPMLGTSNGPMGMLNVDLLKEVNFSSGGFSSLYGDKLSSVMNIYIREGNRDEFDMQLNLDFGGYGGVIEGPISDKGSYLVSIRQSYLDLLTDILKMDAAPRYADYQIKLAYDLSASQKLTLFGMFGNDHITSDKKKAIDNKQIFFGSDDNYENTLGLNLFSLWSKEAYSNFSISGNLIRYGNIYYETGNGELLMKNKTDENILKFRNQNRINLSEMIKLDLGIDYKHSIDKFDNYYASYTDAEGSATDALIMKKDLSVNKVGLFVNSEIFPVKDLKLIFGLRADYNSLTKRTFISPRSAIEYSIDDLSSITGSFGIYKQNLPAMLLAQNKDFLKLNDPAAIHYILGYNRMLTEDTKFTTELYYKDYNNFPIDPMQPDMFMIDEIQYRYGFFFNHPELVDNGKARSYGIEFILQKKLAADIYGLASFTYFKTEYKSNGKWMERVFNNEYILSLEGGYKPNEEWEFSGRWILAGGRPYTPFDIPKSTEMNRAVLDASKLNSEKLSPYHSLNIRADKRFHFGGSNLVVFLNIYNVYDRKNVSSYFWNQDKNEQDVIYQWGILPIFGFEYEL